MTVQIQVNVYEHHGGWRPRVCVGGLCVSGMSSKSIRAAKEEAYKLTSNLKRRLRMVQEEGSSVRRQLVRTVRKIMKETQMQVRTGNKSNQDAVKNVEQHGNGFRARLTHKRRPCRGPLRETRDQALNDLDELRKTLMNESQQTQSPCQTDTTDNEEEEHGDDGEPGAGTEQVYVHTWWATGHASCDKCDNRSTVFDGCPM